MNHRLTIGITRLEPGWRILLEGLGVTVEPLSAWAHLAPERYSALIVTDDPGSDGARACEEYMNAGGGVLDAGGLLSRLDNGSVRKRHLRFAIPDNSDTLFRPVWLVDLESTLMVHREAAHCGGLVHLLRYGTGALASLPLPVNRLLTDIERRRREFHADSPRFPNEIVSRISKGEVRRMAAIALRWLHTERGLPWLHRPNVPDGDRGIFCYRIDSDHGTREQVEQLHEAAHVAGGRLTWFLHVEAHADWLDIFRRFTDDEIALHCFRHRSFRDYDESRANIVDAGERLAEAGIHYSGYAAPNGFWSRGLARAVEEIGFEYASEFALNYDDIPFHPWLQDRFAKTLQVPIHPVCIGSFVRAKGSESVMKEYFRTVIDRAVARDEAAILYHHPGHETFDVMADSISYARSVGLRAYTMGEYAAWWRRRSAVRYEAFFDGESISLRWKQRDSGVRLVVERSDREFALLNDNEAWRLDALDWQRRHETRTRPDDLASTRRRFNPLLWRQGLEDFNARIRQ